MDSIFTILKPLSIAIINLALIAISIISIYNTIKPPRFRAAALFIPSVIFAAQK